MNFTKMRGSTKSEIGPDDLEKVNESLLLEIVETIAVNDVSEDLIFNWDQTGINLVPRAPWTMKKWIEIAELQDKRQITVVMCRSIMSLIYYLIAPNHFIIVPFMLTFVSASFIISKWHWWCCMI